ncbi:hypothetical protein [Microvirga makkahensis]|uniref:Tripartite tricarboxylate transporter family receptor n=1 Tax=Microvirga makkahensis TaxID=1128670 RepID=A0A7X3MW37_9HYPH|nr:hypothetical protein [Microvirga makkahensis]MXQ14336.1 hypothetical protein [Microvirga makkahensis]
MKPITYMSLRVALVLGLGFASTVAVAQNDYPARPIKVVMPFTAGGGVDTVGRILGEGLKEVLGQSVVIENS